MEVADQHQSNTRQQRPEESFSRVKNTVFNMKNKNPLGFNQKERQWEMLCPPTGITSRPRASPPSRTEEGEGMAACRAGLRASLSLGIFATSESQHTPTVSPAEEGRGHSAGAHQVPSAHPSISHRPGQPCSSPAVAHVAQGVTHGVF